MPAGSKCYIAPTLKGEVMLEGIIDQYVAGPVFWGVGTGIMQEANNSHCNSAMHGHSEVTAARSTAPPCWETVAINGLS